ncbi:beta-N-acetylglucosaminidase domain-containing protein [Streptomyces bluensis]|uniref:Beta-N-acetylglucosaminidase domain-containing protein n=1 Tax=Streptomyces bluensis TaxID=33897 RepID=A0ABW6U9I5_9ACTN
MDKTLNRRPALKPVLVGLLAALALCAPGFAPAPAVAADDRSATAPVSATEPVPEVWPTPQQVRPGHGSLPVPRRVVEVVGRDTDPPARRLVEKTLRAAGARTITTVTAGDPVPPAALTVYVGGPGENPATAKVLSRLGTTSPAGLPSGGYALAAGQGRVALSGVDTTGTYYAAQTLRQLVTGRRSVPATTVRDWPEAPLRGVIEGFYGAPWSHQDRLSQLDFYGRTKQNVYVYSPKDDPYLRANWRDEYPADQLARLKQLVDRAAENHVRFTYALSPGLSVCYSSASDRAALVAKFESLYAIGVRSFAVPLDDISYTTWNCPQDQVEYGTGGGAAGTAQAALLNSVVKDFVDAHGDVQPLEMVPTEYSDLADSPYKAALREKLDHSVVVEWTGVGVIAPTISTEQARQAREVFGHPILIWDNYPVNDYTTSRLLLGPYTGREPGVTAEVTGITANPMVQAEASKLALFTSADYAWNPEAYDPRAAFLASVRDLGGPAAAAPLRIFAENSYSSLLDTTESPTLRPLIAAFTTAYENENGSGQATKGAARRLSAYFASMADVPADLRARLDNPGFLTETSAWLDKLGAYGDAGGTAVKLMLAQANGDDTAVSTYYDQLQERRKELDAVPQQIAPGVMDRFLFDATLRAAPDPGPDASFAPSSLTLAPGASDKVTLTVADNRSTAEKTVHWTLDVPHDLTVSPSSGALTVPAGGKATATVTFTAGPGADDGVRSVVVAGDGLVSRAIPVRVTDGKGSDRALTANFSGASVSSVDLESGTATEIPVGKNPGEVVVSADGRTAYAANQGSDTVSVIDVVSGEVTRTVAVGDVPAGLALTPDGRTLWVADYADDAVQPIDLTTGTAGARIAVGDGPEKLAITPDGSTLYVANIHDSTVTPVDLSGASATAGRAIRVGPNPFDVVASPDGRTVYVSNSGGSASSTVTPIDTATNDTRPTLLVTGQAYGLALSPDGRTLWVSASTGDTVTPVDTVTGAPGTPVTVGRSAFDVALDWNGTTAYVTTADAGTLVPVTTATGAVGTALKTGAYPLAAAVTPVPVG